jgi:type I restriction enzyme M protein
MFLRTVTTTSFLLTELLKDSNYKLTQFSEAQIASFEESIFLKENRGKHSPYITCLSREREIKLTPEEATALFFKRQVLYRCLIQRKS